MKKLVLIVSGLLFLCGCGGGKPAAPVMSVSLSPSTQTAMDQGQTLSYTATVANDSGGSGVSWSMSGTTCTGTACGTFSGKTTSGATYNAPTPVSSNMTVKVTATSVADSTKSVFSTVVVSPPPSITTTSLAGGTVGTAYNTTLKSSGGAGALTWSLASGSSLPAGLVLSSSGTLSGTPTTPATSNFTVKLADSSGAKAGPVSATQALSIAIEPAALTITTSTMSNGVVGTAYSAPLAASGGTGAITWSVTTGTLPGGFTVSGSAISGTPSSAGTSSFTVTAKDSGTPPQSKNQALSITINPQLAITTAALPNGVVNTAYSTSLQASGGVGTIAWSVTTGTLPPGLSMSSSGAISGTPTTAGAVNFTVTAKDSGTPQQTVNQALGITVYAGLTITTTSLPNGTVASAYSATLQSGGGTGTVTWSVTTGSLPAGLSLSSAGAISGTPTTSASTNFTVTAKDSGTPQQTKNQALSITINPALSITTTSLPGGTVGTAYSQTIGTTGGTLPIIWSVTTATLPSGLKLQGQGTTGVSGTITGTPSAAGTSNFTVTATDSSTPPVSVKLPLSIVINNVPLGTVTTSLPNGVVSTLYNQALQASGGTPPYTWTVASGSTLPSWLSITGSGTSWTISGTPTAAGTATFSLKVSDSSAPTQSLTVPLSLTITAAAACTDKGSESLLKGQYAFGLSGYTESGFLAAVGSFTADGTGKITAGVLDSNGTIVQSAASIDTTKSFYAIGSNHLGCATIVTSSGTFTTKLSVGGITSNVATAGRLVEWDDATNVNYLTAVGQILKQTVPTNVPSGSYVYQYTGVYGSSTQYRTGVVGMITTQAGTNGGTVTYGEYDVNVRGVINNGGGLSAPFTGITGTYAAPDPTTGRFTDATTLNNVTDHHVGYLVSDSKFVQLSTDALTSDTSILYGLAQLQSGSLSLTTGSKLVYYTMGTESAELGLINVTGSTSYTATYYEDVGGTPETPQSPTCTYAIDAHGRMLASGATCTMYLTTFSKMYPPVFYLSAPNTGVMLGTGLSVYVGQVDPQVAPSGGFSASSLTGTFYDGDVQVVNEGVSGEMIGVEALTFNGSGGLNIIGDYIGAYIGTAVNQETDQTANASVGTVNSNGTFSTNSTYGQINAIMISTTKVVDIDNATQANPIIQVIKQ